MNNNPNNLKVGDTIYVEQAWEDESGAYPDEHPTILAINEKGEMSLDFGNQKINGFLEGADFLAIDYKAEPAP